MCASGLPALSPQGIRVSGISAGPIKTLAAGITGEILYVDGGFSTVGLSFPETAEGG